MAGGGMGMHGHGAGMRGNGPGGVPEKSKRGMMGILRELLQYAPGMKLPVVIALVLAAAGTVFTIIGRDQLIRI